LNRRLWLGASLLAVVGIAAALSYPLWYPQVWKWRSHLHEVPLAGATVSYRDFGTGSPTMVIISGMSVPKDAYYRLQKRLSAKTRVISYDRPGIGDSTPNTEPRTLDYIDRDLKTLLTDLKLQPPYILVGHSLGGHIIRYYASRHPGEVAGLVFLDAPHEDWFETVRRTWSKEEADAYFQWWTATNPDYAGTRLEEMLAYARNCDMIRGVKIPADIPVLMFTSSNYGHFRKSEAGLAEDRRNWAALQASVLDGVKERKLLVDMQLSHWLFQEKAEWVAGEIDQFVDRVRARAQSPEGVNPRSPSP
jgi:pimeloyl-ACP methyl ester carboxylesterase